MSDVEVIAKAGENAYASLADADGWFVLRDQSEWATASTVARNGALIRAAEWLDGHFRFRGDRLHSGQLRAWPRTGIDGGARNLITSLPKPVEQAYFELCLSLLEGTIAGEQLLGVRGAVLRERIGSVAVQYDRSGARQSRIFVLVQPYLRDSRHVQVNRA